MLVALGYNVGMDSASLTYPAWNGRAILLVDLDAFFASVEQLDHPAWRGKPVIVGGDADKRGVVSTCSYEARAYGVRSAMPAVTAAKLCPDAIWTHGHFDRYREVSNQVMAILRDETPLVQQVSIDEAFLDVTPTPHVPEHPVSIAQRIQRRVAQLGVSCSIGVGTSKSVAKVASDMDKPRGLTVVFPGTELDFLGPLPIRKMSGIGPAAERELKAHGVRTLRDVAFADESLLRRVFGKNASMMRARCDGSDASPVEVDDEMKSISNEMTFAQDLTTRADVEAALDTACAKVCRRARRKDAKGRTVFLKLRFEDRSVHSVQRKLAHPSNDEYAIMPVLHRMLGELWSEGMGVRLAGVGLSQFEEETAVQESLFALEEAAPNEDDVAPSIADDHKREGLIAATDKVRDRFGDGLLQFGREMRSKQNLTGSSSKNVEDYK